MSRLLGTLLPLFVALAVACDGETVIHSTSKLGDTLDRIGPYLVLSEISDPDGVDEVSLLWRAGSTAEVAVAMEEVRQGIFEGRIPGQPPFTTVKYFVMAVDGDSTVTDPAGALAGNERFSFQVLGTKCVTDIDCGPGELCDASQVCRQHLGPCTTDAECGKGLRCGEDGACRLATRSCALDETCLVGEVCDTLLGECIPRPLCSDDQPCPLDFACDKYLGICKRACIGNADCGPGETCLGKFCSGAEHCVKDENCTAGLVCEPVLGYCRPAGAAPCAPCVRDADCGGPTDFCLLLADGQYCGADCSSAACPAGYSCSKDAVPPQCVPTSGVCVEE